MSKSVVTEKLHELAPDAVRDLLASNPSRWDGYLGRDKKYAELSEGKTIPLLYNNDRADSYLPHFFPENSDLWKVLRPALSMIEKSLGPGYWCRAMLAQLGPGARIKPHFDPGWPFAIQRRFHWVIETNPDVKMICGKHSYHFSAGEIWSFNNKEVHAVENRGSTPRVHVIADYCSRSDSKNNPMSDWSPSAEEGRLVEVLFKRHSSRS